MAEADEITRELLLSLAANDALKRRHASFWNFYKKTSKELGVFSEILERFENDYMAAISEWGLCENDPPDAFVKFLDGRLVGIEITELVNQSAIEAQINGSSCYSEELIRFDFDVALTALQNIVSAKERKVDAVAGSYDELVLLIHTDEFMLKSDQFSPVNASLDESAIIARIFLLFSYEPYKKTCPLVRLA